MTLVEPNGARREGFEPPNRQIRRLVLYVHAVRLSAVCAAQVRCQIQGDRQSPVWYWLVDCHADCHGSRLAISWPVACSASIWSAPDGSGLLTLDGSSVQTDPDQSRRVVWMINRMIKQVRRSARSPSGPPLMLPAFYFVGARIDYRQRRQTGSLGTGVGIATAAA
jgi:hypothetical protein